MGASEGLSCEDPAVLRILRSGQRSRRFEESARQLRQLFDELVADPVSVTGVRQVLDMVGESADDGRLRSKACEPKLHHEPAVVVGFESAEEGYVSEHGPAAQAMTGPRSIRARAFARTADY